MIHGIQKTSFIDYPKKIAYVIFLGGCNMRCPFCHNKSIVNKESDRYHIDQILSDLKKRIHFNEAVVITGGEPTIYKDELIDLIFKIRDLGYLIKLDTNGTNPDVVKELLDNNLLDYIAMDIKNVFYKYEETCGVKVDIPAIEKTVNLIKNSNINYEFRTTVNKNMHKKEDILQIKKYIGNNYFIQSYKYSTEQIKDIRYEEYKAEELEEISKKYDINIRL